MVMTMRLAARRPWLRRWDVLFAFITNSPAFDEGMAEVSEMFRSFARRGTIQIRVDCDESIPICIVYKAYSD
jgi:hypothetical protein